MDDLPLVFISYASPDRDRVLGFYDNLCGSGFDVWIDVRQLKGGQNWDFEIRRALSKAAIIVVFLSANSVDRRGYAQREIKIALDQARDRLVDDIYLIPILLDPDTPIPAQLRDIHVIRGEDGTSKAELEDAIRHQLDRSGVQTAHAQGEAKVRWTFSTYRDRWDGLPGYETEFQLIKLNSEEYPQASEITDIIKGWLMRQAMNARLIKFEQSAEQHHFGQSRHRRQNTWDASCGEPRIVGRVLSIVYSVWWYGAGAAHPNQYFRTFVFVLDPLAEISALEEVFEDRDAAFAVLRDEARGQLLASGLEGSAGENDSPFDKDWVESGTQNWDSFRSFVFGSDGLEILFSPYHVAPYAVGPQAVTIDYKMIAKLMRREYAGVLGIEYLTYDSAPWIMAEPNPLKGESSSDQSPT